jgi:hypothetical protein
MKKLNSFLHKENVQETLLIALGVAIVAALVALV